MKRFYKKVAVLLAAIFICLNFNVVQAIEGIDVSQHNGYIDWLSVKDSGINDVIIKATEGVDFQDPKLNVYYSQAKALNFNIGFYHFFSERTSPTRQAEDFYNAIMDKEYNIIPVLDVETNTYERSSFELTNRCLEFLNRFTELSGQDCIIYTGAYFGLTELDFRIKGYKLWEAHYNYSNSLECMSTGFINLVGHQWTETGSVRGISGNVDMNYFTDGIYLDSVNVVPAVNQEINIYAELQKELNKQGFRDKNGNELVVDGIPGELTLSACPTVREGARGEITKWIQLRVGAEPDGIFGEKTKQAVKYYQKANGLNGDGIVGNNNWSVLLKLI